MDNCFWQRYKNNSGGETVVFSTDDTRTVGYPYKKEMNFDPCLQTIHTNKCMLILTQNG